MRSIPKDSRVPRSLLQGGAREGHSKTPLELNHVWPENYSVNSAQKVWAASFAAHHPNVVVLDLSSLQVRPRRADLRPHRRHHRDEQDALRRACTTSTRTSRAAPSRSASRRTPTRSSSTRSASRTRASARAARPRDRQQAPRAARARARAARARAPEGPGDRARRSRSCASGSRSVRRARRGARAQGPMTTRGYVKPPAGRTWRPRPADWADDRTRYERESHDDAIGHDTG